MELRLGLNWIRLRICEKKFRTERVFVPLHDNACMYKYLPFATHRGMHQAQCLNHDLVSANVTAQKVHRGKVMRTIVVAGLTAVGLAIVGAGVVSASVFSGGAVFNPVVQVDGSSETRSVNVATDGPAIADVNVFVDFTSCDNPINSATGPAKGRVLHSTLNSNYG